MTRAIALICLALALFACVRREPQADAVPAAKPARPAPEQSARADCVAKLIRFALESRIHERMAGGKPAQIAVLPGQGGKPGDTAHEELLAALVAGADRDKLRFVARSSREADRAGQGWVSTLHLTWGHTGEGPQRALRLQLWDPADDTLFFEASAPLK